MSDDFDIYPVHLGVWRTSGLTNRQIRVPLCDVNDRSVSGKLTDALAKVTCEECKADHAHVRRPTCYGHEKCGHDGYCDNPCHYDIDRIVAELRAALNEACDYLKNEGDGGMQSTPKSEIDRLRKLVTCPSKDQS
jgi:hypothetical protein